MGAVPDANNLTAHTSFNFPLNTLPKISLPSVLASLLPFKYFPIFIYIEGRAVQCISPLLLLLHTTVNKRFEKKLLLCNYKNKNVCTSAG